MSTGARVTGLSNTALLAAWEAGQGQAPLDQAHAVLWYALPDGERPALDGWTMGRRDSCLLDVYAGTFGEHIAGLVACPRCDEQLEIALRPDDIRSPYGDAAAELELCTADPAYHVVFRLPSSADLRASAAHAHEAAARGALLERCVLVAEHAGAVVPVDELPAAVVARLEALMAEHDSQADVQLAMTCPGCEHAWQARFDIADFLWCAVEARARHLINDIHTLALAYGWRETDVLTLSEARRKMYLKLLLR